MVHWNRASISSRFRDIQLQIMLTNDEPTNHPTHTRRIAIANTFTDSNISEAAKYKMVATAVVKTRSEACDYCALTSSSITSLPYSRRVTRADNEFLHPFPQNWGWQPPVKTCISNCGQRYQIQGWLVLTAYGNLPAPYPTAPSSVPRGSPSHKIGVIEKLN